MGGNVLVNAEGDGLDSNGTLTLSGGTVVVWGQKSGGDNAPPDLTSFSGAFTVSGSAGTVAKTTCSHSMTTLGSTATCGEAGEMVSICTLCGEAVAFAK